MAADGEDPRSVHDVATCAMGRLQQLAPLVRIFAPQRIGTNHVANATETVRRRLPMRQQHSSTASPRVGSLM